MDDEEPSISIRDHGESDATRSERPVVTDLISHMDSGEQEVTPVSILKYLLILNCILIPIFCVVIWIIHMLILVLLPDYSQYTAQSFFYSSSGLSLFTAIGVGFSMICGFIILKYNMYRRTSNDTCRIYWEKNRVFDRNPVISGIIFGMILVFILPVNGWFLISPYLHYLPYTYPILHIWHYCEFMIHLIFFSILITVTISLIPPTWVKAATRVPADIPENERYEPVIKQGKNQKGMPRNFLKICSRWLILSTGVFPVTLGTMILIVLVVTSYRYPQYENTHSGVVHSIQGFVFPGSFLTGNGPVWGLLILGYTVYISLIYAAIYLISRYGNLDTFPHSGTRALYFLWIPLLETYFVIPFTGEIVNQDLISQGITKMHNFSPKLEFCLIVMVMALILGYSLAYLDSRLDEGRKTGNKK